MESSSLVEKENMETSCDEPEFTKKERVTKLLDPEQQESCGSSKSLTTDRGRVHAEGLGGLPNVARINRRPERAQAAPVQRREPLSLSAKLSLSGHGPGCVVSHSSEKAPSAPFEATPTFSKKAQQAFITQRKRLATPNKLHAASPIAKRVSLVLSDLEEPSFSYEPEDERTTDPLFGDLLHDFGYRRLYLARATQVVNRIPLWNSQRPHDPARVEEIAKAHMENPTFQGTISVFLFENTKIPHPSIFVPQSMAIFDGQHRVLAAAQLVKQHPELQLLVEVYPVQAMCQVVDCYVEVNKSVPVQEVDLPDAIATFKKQYIDDAVAHLQEIIHETMFRPSVRCRPPHVHIPMLRNRIFEAKVIERRDVKSSDHLFDLIMAQNQRLSRKDIREYPQRLKKAVKKAKKYLFFLGLDNWDWVERM